MCRTEAEGGIWSGRIAEREFLWNALAGCFRIHSGFPSLGLVYILLYSFQNPPSYIPFQFICPVSLRHTLSRYLIIVRHRYRQHEPPQTAQIFFRECCNFETTRPPPCCQMSFSFKWPRFSDQFHADAIQMLDAALNKGNKPPVIADKIEVVELEMGTQVCWLIIPYLRN